MPGNTVVLVARRHELSASALSRRLRAEQHSRHPAEAGGEFLAVEVASGPDAHLEDLKHSGIALSQFLVYLAAPCQSGQPMAGNPFAPTLLSSWLASRQAQENQLLIVSTLVVGFLATLFREYQFDAANVLSVIRGVLGVAAGGCLLFGIVLATRNFREYSRHARAAFLDVEFGSEKSLEEEEAAAKVLEGRSLYIRRAYLAGLGITVFLIVDWERVISSIIANA